MSVLIVGGGFTGATLALAISRLTGGALPVQPRQQHVRRLLVGASHRLFQCHHVDLGPGRARRQQKTQDSHEDLLLVT